MLPFSIDKEQIHRRNLYIMSQRLNKLLLGRYIIAGFYSRSFNLPLHAPSPHSTPTNEDIEFQKVSNKHTTGRKYLQRAIDQKITFPLDTTATGQHRLLSIALKTCPPPLDLALDSTSIFPPFSVSNCEFQPSSASNSLGAPFFPNQPPGHILTSG